MIKTAGDYASTSYGLNPTIYYGRVENIDDGQGEGGGSAGSPRNRCKVRMFGYEDSVDKERLEWCHAVSTTSSQMHGDTSTQPYYPGSQVMILEIGTERYILGSVPGFDSNKKLKDNPDGADNSSDQNADVPNNQINKGQYTTDTNSVVRASQGIIPNGGRAGLDQYFDYGSWDSSIRKLYKSAIGKGDKPAPYGEGLVARYADMKGIGYDRTQKGSDVLDVIKQKDGNESGAIKQSIDIAKALFKSQRGTGNEMVGSSLQQQADQQYMNFFGNQLHFDILGLLTSLRDVKNVVVNLTPETFYQAVMDNTLSYGTSLFQNVTLNVSQDYINNMYDAIDHARIVDTQAPTVTGFLSGELELYRTNFRSAMNQSVTSIFNLFDTVYATGDNPYTAFGDPGTLTQIAFILQDLYSYSTGATDLPPVGGGILQQALQGTLSLQPNLQQQQLTRDMLRFQGNQQAMQELQGGGKQIQNPLNIPHLYEGGTDPQHPNNERTKSYAAEGAGR